MLNHIYSEEGPKTVTVTVTNVAKKRSASATFQVMVSDPPVLAEGGFTIAASQGVPFSGQTVATFTDPGGADQNASDDAGGKISSHYTAEINWDDNTGSFGDISYSGSPGSTTELEHELFEDAHVAALIDGGAGFNVAHHTRNVRVVNATG